MNSNYDGRISEEVSNRIGSKIGSRSFAKGMEKENVGMSKTIVQLSQLCRSEAWVLTVNER